MLFVWQKSASLRSAFARKRFQAQAELEKAWAAAEATRLQQPADVQHRLWQFSGSSCSRAGGERESPTGNGRGEETGGALDHLTALTFKRLAVPVVHRLAEEEALEKICGEVEVRPLHQLHD